MGSSDIPPPNVPQYFHAVSNSLLQSGGSLWTLAYVLYFLSSLRDKSYGMPLFALAINFAWEVVYAIFVAEEPLERAIFVIWMIVDLGLVYAVVVYGKEEWRHAPAVADSLGVIFALLTAVATVGHWTFAKWWIDNGIGGKPGKTYRGVEGSTDTTELGFWSAGFCGAHLSAASLAMLIVRGHSRGVDRIIWLCRTLGSLIGFDLYFIWRWYVWREAHLYVMSPFGLFLWVTNLACDLVYPYVLWQVMRKERKEDIPLNPKLTSNPREKVS